MGILSEKVKLSLLVNGDGLVDNFKNNSMYFSGLYNDSIEEFKQIGNDKIYPGKFYFLHYLDESNWMRYSPIFLADYKVYSNKTILFGVNMNFIPLEIRVMLFDRFITDKDIEKDNFLEVDLQGIYDELRKLGFEYALVEYDMKRVKLTHQVSLTLLPRFLYHQHPETKYNPNKLMEIWEAKIKKREQRHQEMTLSLIDDFFNVNKDISDKYDALKGKINRMRRNSRKYG